MARKEKQCHFIYKTTNTVTGRYYYGMHSTDNLEDGYLGSGKRLRYSINKYGKDVHQLKIVEFCPDRSSLKKREKKLITLNEIAKIDCMNLKEGGDGGFISEEQQRYRSSCGGKAHSEKLKSDNEYRNCYSKKMSDIRKKDWKSGKYSHIRHDYFLNKKHSNETKEKMSKSHKGRGVGENNSQFGTCWITNSIENRKIKKSQPIPNGWYIGRIIKTDLNIGTASE